MALNSRFPRSTPEPSVVPLRIFLLLAPVGCGTGQQIAAGPVVGYVSGRGLSAGWEVGGGPTLLARFSVGMSWRPGSSKMLGSERLSYVAWEPWLLAGGTLGVAHSSATADVNTMGGVWEGAPWIFGAPTRSILSKQCSPCYTISLAIGWRWSGTGEFYLAPKLGILNGTAMPFLYQAGWAHSD